LCNSKEAAIDIATYLPGGILPKAVSNIDLIEAK